MSVLSGGGSIHSTSSCRIRSLFGGTALEIEASIAIVDFSSAPTHQVRLTCNLPFTFSGKTVSGFAILHPNKGVMESIIVGGDTQGLIFSNRNYTSGLPGTDGYVRFSVTAIIFED